MKDKLLLNYANLNPREPRNVFHIIVGLIVLSPLVALIGLLLWMAYHVIRLFLGFDQLPPLF